MRGGGKQHAKCMEMGESSMVNFKLRSKQIYTGSSQNQVKQGKYDQYTSRRLGIFRSVISALVKICSEWSLVMISWNVCAAICTNKSNRAYWQQLKRKSPAFWVLTSSTKWPVYNLYYLRLQKIIISIGWLSLDIFHLNGSHPSPWTTSSP